MSNQTFNEALVARIASATIVSNTTVETVIVPDFVIPAGYMYQGRWLRGRIRGGCSNVVTTPGTITFRIRIGPTTLSTVSVNASPAIVLDPVAHTTASFVLNFDLVCQGAGTTGALQVMGDVELGNVNPTAANLIPYNIPQSNAGPTTSIDTTVQNLLSVSAQFSVATNPTNIQSYQYFLESLT